jgi:hypothetical protein
MKTAIILSLVVAAGLLFIAMNPQPTSTDQQFEDFTAAYGRNYLSVNEANFRKGVFKANMINAAELDRLNPEAEFGMTIFSDRTESEMRQRMGAFDPHDTSDDIEIHTQETAPSKSIDYRNILESVQDQGQCGSCWAFSATATFEARLALSGKSSYKASEQEALDCSDKNYGCNGGWYEAVWKWSQAKNFCTLASYKYKHVKGSCKQSTCDGREHSSSYKMVAKSESAMYDALKTGPISIAVDASTWSSYRGGVMTTCGHGMDHAVVLAGYNKEKDAWVIRNSWGSRWGEKGYVYVKQGKNVCNLTYKPAYPTF